MAMYDPIWTSAGDVNRNGDACLGIGDAAAEPDSPTFSAFVSEAGPHSVPRSERAYELPFAPQQLVGLQNNVKTGPQLILYAHGFPDESPFLPVVEPVSWTLKKPNGQRVPDVRMADHDRAAARGYGKYVRNVAFMIPTNPLRRDTSYHAHVKWRAKDGTTAIQALSFHTR
jgi:hypothetical protein